MYNTTIESMDKNFGLKNYSRGENARMITIGELDIYFSYDTVIAFCKNYGDLIITKNVWGTITGRHLNDINNDKSLRIPYGEFKTELKKLLNGLKL